MRSKMVRDAITRAIETSRNTISWAARLSTPRRARSEAARAPTPNHKRTKPLVKISAAAKVAAMINQTIQVEIMALLGAGDDCDTMLVGGRYRFFTIDDKGFVGRD